MDSSATTDEVVRQEKEQLTEEIIIRPATAGDIPYAAGSAKTDEVTRQEKEQLTEEIIIRPATADDIPYAAGSAKTDEVIRQEKEQLTEEIIIRPATADDIPYAEEIAAEMEASAKARGTGIAKRSPFSIAEKIRQGKAVIALTVSGIWAGFSYLETWEQDKFISNSGLIVAPAFRIRGIAAMIKQKIFQLSRSLYPTARIFSITTGRAVMKLNTRLGFEPVTYAEITKDPAFWEGCKSCVNYSILCAKGRQNCLCTALLFEPS